MLSQPLGTPSETRASAEYMCIRSGRSIFHVSWNLAPICLRRMMNEVLNMASCADLERDEGTTGRDRRMDPMERDRSSPASPSCLASDHGLGPSISSPGLRHCQASRSKAVRRKKKENKNHDKQADLAGVTGNQVAEEHRSPRLSS